MTEKDSLSSGHRAMLETESGNAPEVIAARGYVTVTTRAELERKGFAASQRNVPTLLIPLWGMTGEVALCHHRPDTPRFRGDRAVKYEFPRGSRMIVDVHPFVRDRLGDPSVPLVITEGRKRAIVRSAGACAVWT